MYKDTDISFLSALQETLSENPAASQRDIASGQNISLGLANAWLSKLAAKGWIMMHRVNGKKIKYVLTPEGMRQLAVRSANYMKKTFSLMHQYGETITNRIGKAKHNGCSRVILYGASSLDFLIEYACRHHAVSFERAETFSSAEEVPENAYGIVSENFVEAADEWYGTHCVTAFELIR